MEFSNFIEWKSICESNNWEIIECICEVAHCTRLDKSCHKYYAIDSSGTLRSVFKAAVNYGTLFDV